MREEFGSDMTPMRRAHYERHIATARISLDEAAFQEARNQGRAMSMDQALKYVLELDAGGDKNGMK